MMSDVKTIKTISNRAFKRGTHEERLAEGEALRVVKAGGKTFLVQRETPPVSMSKLYDEIMAEIPTTGTRQKTDLARWLSEEEE